MISQRDDKPGVELKHPAFFTSGDALALSQKQLMSYKSVCLLSAEEGELLAMRGPQAICCQHHVHIKPEFARALLHGSEFRPWLNDFSFKPMAKEAFLPDGKRSKRHIIQTIEYNWRVIADITCEGARGVSGWQLLPTKKPRLVESFA